MKSALTIPDPGSMSGLTEQKRAQANKLCEMMCAYKLIDTLYLLQEQDTPTFNRPLYPKNSKSLCPGAVNMPCDVHGADA